MEKYIFYSFTWKASVMGCLNNQQQWFAQIVWKGVDALIPRRVLLRISTIPGNYGLSSKALEISVLKG